ncbi:MAG: HEAT repeat domain-containing protein [Terriglobia bacterium]
MDESLKSDRSLSSPKPSEVEVVQALVEIEKASKDAPAQSGEPPSNLAPQESWASSKALVVIYIAVMAAIIVFLAWGAQRVVKRLLSSSSPAGWSNGNAGVATGRTTDAARQAEAEGLLERVAAGDLAAANQVLAQSDGWTGKTQTTPKTDQFITTGINGKELQARAAAIQAQLALNGIPRDESGLNTLEKAVGNPTQRTWALWLLGALGNRGVDPEHTAKIIDAYLVDPDVTVRRFAVIGLALLATDETIPMLLDRFRNDPSPAVQELAVCGLSESGMYTHGQRMVAAASLVGWLDDPLLTQQQRAWAAQGLRYISGKNLGTDSAAWRHWYESTP